MAMPNISLTVKHDTTKQGNAFSQETYDRLRQQQSNLLSRPYATRLEDVFCDDKEHHDFETEIIVTAADRTYEITKVCCEAYRDKLNEALAGVENDLV